LGELPATSIENAPAPDLFEITLNDLAQEEVG
jgi:hypothetical protein